MIQALNLKTLDSKALTGAKGAAASKGEVAGADGLLNPEAMLENADFANELMASLATDTQELQVKPVEVGAEQMMEQPSSLLNMIDVGQPENINPTIIDPALTQGVEKAIQPKTTQLSPEMLKVLGQQVEAAQVTEVPADVKAEISQALLKTPQMPAVQSGRAPAIEFAQTEIDPQLMNMEDFVAQKNLAAKKNVHTSAYGISKPQMQKVALENGLKQTQVVKDLAALENPSTNSSPVNSQQFILNMMSEQNGASKMNDLQAAAPVKTFDMSQIKSDNSNQILSQVSDYIVQAKAAKEPTVNMRVNHEELGMIDITVQKAGMGQDTVAINIGAHSADGKNFFQMNSKDLFSHLTQAGINVSDLKVETPSQTGKNDFDMGGQSGRQGSGAERQFGSEQNQRRHESERRQDLWNLLKDKEAA